MDPIIIPRRRIPLTREAHSFALEIAAEQATPEKGRRVYLNALAVQAVQRHLNLLEIEVDLEQGGWRQPEVRAVLDIADLNIPGAGRLECRPVLPGETVLVLPPGLHEDLIGYVAVQFSNLLDAVELLGFISADVAETLEEVRLGDLQPLEALLDHLFAPNKRLLTNLNCLLAKLMGAGWCYLSELFEPNVTHPALARSSRYAEGDVADQMSLGKIIDMGIEVAEYQVILAVTFAPILENDINVLVQVRPSLGQPYLPVGLELFVLDETGTIQWKGKAEEFYNLIQWEFTINSRESFNVRVVLDNFAVAQNFSL